MESDELTQSIIRDLVKQRSRNDIIQRVCERAGLNWPQAEQLVRRVEADHAHAIARGQSPLLILLSIGSILIGLALLYLAIDYLVGFVNAQLLEELLSVRSAWYRLAGGVTGLGMVVGGLIGLWRTTSRYFET